MLNKRYDAAKTSYKQVVSEYGVRVSRGRVEFDHRRFDPFGGEIFFFLSEHCFCCCYFFLLFLLVFFSIAVIVFVRGCFVVSIDIVL